MPRRPRLHFPGAPYHVILRGNARQDIFFEDEDRYRFCFLVQEGVERFRHRVAAFCLMTNHVHLAIQVADVPLSRIPRNLSFRYTRWINRRGNRSGHLLQGRYKAFIVEKESYLLEVSRYIHLNPTSAKLVKNPEDWMYSSYCEYLGIDSQQNTVCVFDKFIEVVPEDYKKFVMDRKDYQAKLSAIKQLSIEDCTS